MNPCRELTLWGFFHTINKITINYKAYPINPPIIVAAISNQSNLPPYFLSLNSIPKAKPVLNNIVPMKADGIA